VGRLLQARGDVDGIARRQPLLGARDDLARADTDSPLDPELREPVAHLHRRPQGPQRVVLVYGRHAEHRHHRVADELLDRAAVTFDDRLHPLEVARQQRPQGLGVKRLAQRGRAGHVAEEHCHGLPHLTRRRLLNQGRATRVTEPRLLGILLTALRAGDHFEGVRLLYVPASRLRAGFTSGW
jgi:hypothetical protein